MGTDIYSFAEVRRDGRWQYAEGPIVTPIDEYHNPNRPFGWRSYIVFGFLADVRNYSDIPPIEPASTRGLPDDLSPEVRAKHGGDDQYYPESWLSLAELLAYDYDREFDDQRPFAGDPVRTTVRQRIGELFFQHLDDLGKLGPPDDVRVVFWFGH
jgi:hypothetical protein